MSIGKLCNAVMAALFLVSAGLQYNDPDPLRWAFLYAAAGVACVQHGRHARDWIAPLLVFALAFAWLGYLTPGLLAEARPSDLLQSMDVKGGSAELAREAGGLAIVAGWMLYLLWLARRRAAPASSAS